MTRYNACYYGKMFVSQNGDTNHSSLIHLSSRLQIIIIKEITFLPIAVAAV